jgi:uncharacterized membrane-anchored protein YitT (DUF2179 family)
MTADRRTPLLFLGGLVKTGVAAETMLFAIQRSLVIGTVTSLYFLPEVSRASVSFPFRVLAFVVQIMHDGVCMLFFELCVRSWQFPASESFLLLNVLHTVIMGLFCFYKRCILTLLYNHVLGIDMCRRYIPIWQRAANQLILSSSHCHVDEWRTTYLWLNNHIIQTMLVGIINLRALFAKLKAP